MVLGQAPSSPARSASGIVAGSTGRGPRSFPSLRRNGKRRSRGSRDWPELQAGGGWPYSMDDSSATSFPLDAERFGNGRIAAIADAGQRRRIVVVLGMHRSGTSLCAHVLSAMGIDMADELRAIPANAKGHWERWEIVELRPAFFTQRESVLRPQAKEAPRSISTSLRLKRWRSQFSSSILSSLLAQ